MKYIYCLLIGVFITLGLSSCNNDNEGAIYKPTTSEVSFISGENNITLGPDDTSFKIRVLRNMTNDADTFDITSNGGNRFSVSETVIFSEGEGYAFINVAINENEFASDKEYNLILKLPEDKISVSGVGTISLAVVKEYDWESLGEGTFTDSWAFLADKVYSVKIYKAKGEDRYRVLIPYTEGYSNDDSNFNDWIDGGGPDYIEFWEIGNDMIRFDSYDMGLNYEAKSGQAIKSYYPTDYKADLGVTYNKKKEKKIYQLAPYYVFNKDNQWDNTQKDNVIIITLP